MLHQNGLRRRKQRVKTPVEHADFWNVALQQEVGKLKARSNIFVSLCKCFSHQSKIDVFRSNNDYDFIAAVFQQITVLAQIFNVHFSKCDAGKWNVYAAKDAASVKSKERFALSNN